MIDNTNNITITHNTHDNTNDDTNNETINSNKHWDYIKTRPT